MTAPPGATQSLIDRLIRDAGALEAVAVIRNKAHQAIDAFGEAFGEPQALPLELCIVASFLGIKLRDAAPLFSPDAELAPDGHGGVVVPRDKAVDNSGPVFEAAQSGRPCDGECHLDLGQAAGTYRVHAVPLWTPAEELGPAGENSVAAVIRPRTICKPRKKPAAKVASLFD
jgi:hypothetical protein